jgi:hypothetical protein
MGKEVSDLSAFAVIRRPRVVYNIRGVAVRMGLVKRRSTPSDDPNDRTVWPSPIGIGKHRTNESADRPWINLSTQAAPHDNLTEA